MKKTNRLAILESMFHIRVGQAFDFDDKLVQRVVSLSSQAERIPAKPLLDAAGDAGLFGLIPEHLLFLLELLLQEVVLALEFGKDALGHGGVNGWLVDNVGGLSRKEIDDIRQGFVAGGFPCLVGGRPDVRY